MIMSHSFDYAAHARTALLHINVNSRSVNMHMGWVVHIRYCRLGRLTSKQHFANSFLIVTNADFITISIHRLHEMCSSKKNT